MDYLAEFLGTAILILLGNGIVYNIIGKSSNASGKDYVNIALAWGLAVMIAVISANAIGGTSFINPAVTLAFLVKGSVAVGKAFGFMAVEILGAMLGQMIVDAIYANQAKELGTTSLGAHATAPAVKGSWKTPILNEFFATIILVTLVIAAGSQFAMAGDNYVNGATKDLNALIGPLIVGLTVTGIGLGLGGVTGWAINPARDLGPRIEYMFYHKIMGFEGSALKAANWEYAAIPTLVPFAGAAVAASFWLI